MLTVEYPIVDFHFSQVTFTSQTAVLKPASPGTIYVHKWSSISGSFMLYPGHFYLYISGLGDHLCCHRWSKGTNYLVINGAPRPYKPGPFIW